MRVGIDLISHSKLFCFPLHDGKRESYGEDIANSENEESFRQSDEDEYEDSFIDDDDNLEVLPPSPVSSNGGTCFHF